MASDPGVSVLVLSYRRPAYLAQALESIAAQSHTPEEVIVSDNRSPASGEVERLVGDRPGVRLLAHAANLGYAAGMNRALAAARGEYVLLTEDDMVLEPDCLELLAGFARSRPEWQLLTGTILDLETGEVVAAGGDASLGGVYRLRLFSRARAEEPYPASYASGAMLFAPRALFERLGGFREEFFMYLEDVELCQRARRRGYPLRVVPRARAFHQHPPPPPAGGPLYYHKLKNLFALYLLHAPARCVPEAFLRYGVVDPWVRGRRDDGWRTDGWRAAGRAWRWLLPRLPGLLRERLEEGGACP